MSYAAASHHLLPTGHIVLNGSGTGLKRRLDSLSREKSEQDAKKCKKCSSKSTIKRAGPFLLGPRLGNSPVRSIVQCLARREGTDDFYSVKLLTLEEPGKETQDGKQGKMLLHTEYSLLSLLHDQKGVVHHHGMFQDEILDDNDQEAPRILDETSLSATMPKIRRRLCLVLDCLCSHDYGNSTADLINLQHYVIREKKLSEREAVLIFYDIVKVVENLHKVRNSFESSTCLKVFSQVVEKDNRDIQVLAFLNPLIQQGACILLI